MRDSVLNAVARWVEAGHGVAVATVADTKKSAPQPIGTKMAINSSGGVMGAVSGGCVEGAVVAVAETILAGGAGSQLLHYGIADEEAWDVGLPCGGEISVWVEPYAPDSLQAHFFTLARTDQRAVLVTRVAARAGTVAASATPEAGVGQAERRLLVHDDGSTRGSLGSRELDDLARELGNDALWSEVSELVDVPGSNIQLFIEATAPKPRLVIIGAVDFAAGLASAARLAGWRPYVIDPRVRFATPERFPDAERVIAAWPQEAIGQIDPIDRATAIAVLTHDPKLDDAALTVALGSDAAYIGAMGSRRAQERRRARLQKAGFSDADLDRISAPIGLDLGALTSGETALSIMGEIIALKHHRSGGRLIDVRGRIHAGTH